VHELATNASKYGALSTPQGRVDISWNLQRIENEPWLVMHWQESGGPPVTEPNERGFGSMLIERSIAYELGGDAVLEFRPQGLACTIKAPVQTIRPLVGERSPETIMVA
jgi:two-component sensor histidine kinase